MLRLPHTSQQEDKLVDHVLGIFDLPQGFAGRDVKDGALGEEFVQMVRGVNDSHLRCMLGTGQDHGQVKAVLAL
eukprot:CAMPEP_0170570518 /NCGR_PEP_ID=MMETSP0224-20130122/1157_1 /TAXON_ID=285029 /ORGANISM="Togula jolla, Strain CCCM 725" /LENGTH=73 /DNA_ID=CAMNT_0010892809 /DNA_START=127 /DNA_END=348 /DNA_ORIENTATION=-